MQRLTQALEFQSQALILRAERQRLIASNIANADTPGYIARDMDFGRALREATAGQSSGGGAGTGGQAGPIAGALAVTQPGHIAPLAGARDEAELLYARHSQDSLDRNTVDLDRERNSFAENAVKYEATLRFINGQVRSMLDAMKSHNQG